MTLRSYMAIASAAYAMANAAVNDAYTRIGDHSTAREMTPELQARRKRRNKLAKQSRRRNRK